MAIFRKKGGKTWFAEYRQATGRRIRKTLRVTDFTAAKMLYAELLKAEQMRRAGVVTSSDAGLSDVAALLTEYEGELERRERAASYIRTVMARLKAIFAGVHRLGEMTSEKIRKTLERLQEKPAYAAKAIRRYKRLSPMTINFYRTALHAFFAWLVREERWPRNPVDSVTPVRQTGALRERRALEPEELKALLAVAAPARSLVYRLAATSGLRRGELRTLQRTDLDLVRGTVTVQARNAKSKKKREVPLPVSTIAALKLALGASTDLVFGSGLPTIAALKRDLTRAGIVFETAAGVVDFHALRATYGTNLARAGVPLAQAQKMLGHSDPRLTANFYTKLHMQDGHGAAAKLQQLLDGGDSAKSKAG